jgi:hypothetical protein
MLEAKEHARKTGKTFKELVIEGLTSVMHQEREVESRPWWEEFAGAFVDMPEHTAAIDEAIAESRVIDPEEWK